MARFVRLTAIRDAGNNIGKVDCTQQVDDEYIGQRAKDHLGKVDCTQQVDDEYIGQRAKDHLGKVDCTQQVDNEYIGQRAKDHLQQPDTALGCYCRSRRDRGRWCSAHQR